MPIYLQSFVGKDGQQASCLEKSDQKILDVQLSYDLWNTTERNRVSWQTVWIQDTVTICNRNSKKLMVDHLTIFPFGHMVFFGHFKGIP